MAKILTFILLFFVVGLLNSFAQSNAVSELKQQIEQGKSEAILEIISEPAKAQDADLKKYLRSLASDEKQRVVYDSPAYFAHIALAKLGEQDAEEQILSEVDMNNPIYLVGMKKLFLVGGKFSFKKFYDLLDDTTQVEIKEDCKEKSALCNDVFFYPKNFVAIFYLSQMVDNPPTRRGVPSNKVSMWKDWFENHKELIR